MQSSHARGSGASDGVAPGRPYPREEPDSIRAGIPLDPADGVRVTILVDNLTDPLVAEKDGVTRLTWGKAFASSAPPLHARFASARRSGPTSARRRPGRIAARPPRRCLRKGSGWRLLAASAPRRSR